jgi:membrane-associated phospholipid phosphatase
MTRRHPIQIPGLILLALALVAGGFLLDAPVEKSVLLSNGGHWHRGACVNALSRYGDWPELMVLGGIAYLLARRARSVKWQRLLLSAMIASTLSGMAVNASRLTTGRTRPRAEAPQGWYGLHHDGRWLIGRADFNSFPSGHTATAVGFAGVLLFGAPAWGAVAAAAAMAVAVSRILLGAHHPSDVIAATVLSLIVAWAVWEFLGKRGRVDLGKQDAAARGEV